MNNNELDDLLKEKFKPLRVPPAGPSLVPKIMSAVAAVPSPEALLEPKGKGQDWILAVALVLGALVCASSFSALDQQALASLLSIEDLGRYAQLATSLLLPALIAVVVLPVAWLATED